ncbi:alpha/beta fold hydrolase [Mucilaginibacter sp. E4BP6]|uniref:alpha/beta fold hydrolase n=1 Tax=Mucilaginibacter sp. E4BP6 TaxID=2723089 RepID=UPI0015CCB1A1|nr:alpha/beta hydrolase [Mucilaginibacter sp. E4BP6]NYE64939.1 pimeloyl-ACP methyl ester carboxylesterase [Mucilaginibacter sp. E4BP6]
MKYLFLAIILLSVISTQTSALAQSNSIIVDYHHTAPTKFIEANGTRYAYRVLGKNSGIPLVLFQHFTGTMDYWDPLVVNGLAHNYQVILFDNKGVGATSGSTPDNIQQMALDAIDFINALGYAKVNLLGFSMGGFIAQQVALDQPQLVNKIILAGTGPQGSIGLSDIVKPLTESAKMSPEDVKLFLFYSPSARSRALGKESLARIHKRTINRDPEASNESIMLQLKSILAWAQPDAEALERLKTLNKPVLIVNGNNDILVPTINSYNMYQAFPDARLVLYPDANHGSIFQYPALFLKEVTAFLAEGSKN